MTPPPDVTPVPYDRAVPIAATTTRPEGAIDALAAVIGEAKGDEMLEPVVVAVPSNTCGVMTRRALGRVGGIAGVDMVTLNRLAELIAGPALAAADRAPMSTPVIDLAIADVLAEEPGAFAAVASHPSTVVALRELHRELRLAGDAAASALAAHSRRGREAVRVSRAATRRLDRRWYDDADLFVHATAAVRAAAPAGLRHLVVHLPHDLRGLPMTFVVELGQRLDVRIVTTRVGDAAADADSVATLDALGVSAVPPEPAAPSPPVRVVSTTDADDEARIATRLVVDAARGGTPFERIAVLWPVQRPYARLVEHHLDAAEIPWNGRPGTAPSERLAPRLVLDLLDVDRRGLRRRDLFAMLADVPARGADGAYLPTASWERVSREAGVARDDDWQRRLGALANSERWGPAAAELSSFISGLRADLGHPAATARWWDWAVWCGDQLDRWIGRQALERLPEPEYRAWEALTRALDRLRHLDPVGAPVTRHRFRATLEAELDDMPGRQGRVGDGVTVGPLAGADGLDVDVVVVLGGAEGTLPPTPRGDPLLSDADRAAAGLPASDALGDRLRRNLLGVCASAAVTVTIPRGDLRATSHNRPSRWIAEWTDDPRLHVVASHTAGLAATEFPASPAEHRLRARFGHVMAGHPVDTAQGADADPVLRRGVALRRARHSDRLTVYDGDLSAVDVPRLDHAVSPSRLEAWAACPHAYFVRYLLDVRAVDEPDDEISITALDRGSATHDALDRFHRAVIDGALSQPTEAGWNDEHRHALGRFFDEVSDETERRGRTGRPAYWAVERERMRADLLAWLDHDSVKVAERRAQVVASEHRFDTDADVSIPLPDGRRVQLLGSIDRVDRCADGLLVVTDHKTGSARRYRGLTADDPTLGGTAFQLPAYAAAARALSGEPDAPVFAEYGLFAKGDYERFGYTVTPDVWAGVQADLAEVVDGIEAGFFPNRPEQPGWRLFVSCEYCEPDHLGTSERWGEWERKRADPRLARWFAPPGADSPAADPPDQAARQRIRNDLDATLFVEAGAGAGKTSSLVDRIVNLVAGGQPITGVAAITFTEKAAAELRTRVRDRLEAAGSGPASAALDQLDHAPIGTLHAFARRVLFEYPIESGLPPAFSVLDELESGLQFEEQWDDLLDRLLDDPAPGGGLLDGGRALVELCEFDGFGIRTGVRRMADDFRANWDLVEERVSLEDPGPLTLDLTGLISRAEQIASVPVPDDDSQAALVGEIGRLALAARGATHARARLDVLQLASQRYGKWAVGDVRTGSKAKWRQHGGAAALDDLRASEQGLARHVVEIHERVRHHRRLVLGAILGRFVIDAAVDRAEAGRLEFHDLLVLARRLLATRADVRARLHDRFPRVLLDEFQDTDPIQLEIAVRLTSAPDAAEQDGRWRELAPLPGRLFIVGDPKQSIYRFRRADIAQYLSAADQVGADRVRLSANFRSSRAVIGFANDVFGRLIEFTEDTQPAFQPLDACRAERLLDHGTVTVLGDECHDDLGRGKGGGVGEVGAADELRRREARDVVGAIGAALAEGWPVGDGDGLRPCRPGDVCVLLPTRISLPALESELRAAQVPYRAENASVVYATTEIRDLLMVLRAADDPTDQLALIAALRSPLYGCSDVELYDWRRAGGVWGLWAEPPAGLGAHPVAVALAHLRSVAERIGWVLPADLLAAVVDERRLLDLALDGPDGRDVWRRVRYVVDQARAWADAGGHGVRRYLAWAKLQAAERSVSDTILPEHDHDAVRIMTIHAAKGLEFPITIVAGLTTQPRRSQTAGVVWADDSWMLAGKGDDGDFSTHQPLDEQMGDAERRRLLYVACTRAVEHLVVSLHRSRPTQKNADYADWGPLTSAELLWAAGASGPTSGAVGRRCEPRPVAAGAMAPMALDWSDPDEWAVERARVLRVASRRTGVAATRLAEEVRALDAGDASDDAGLDKHPVNVDLPAWQRGRYGTAIGRAVHGVLQFCALDDGHDIDTLARAQCAAEGVIGLDGRVASLARSALGAPIVRSVADGLPHWRELFVAAPIGDRVVEGYVDLLVRTAGGLVIVDYKTDQWSGPVQSAERIGRYRIQLAAYGAALEVVLREPVVGGILVHCRPDHDAEQIDVAGWDDALDEVRRLVS